MNEYRQHREKPGLYSGRLMLISSSQENSRNNVPLFTLKKKENSTLSD